LLSFEHWCCCCHSATEKVKYDNKVVNSVFHCSNNQCRMTIDRDMNGAANIYMLLAKSLPSQQNLEFRALRNGACHETWYSARGLVIILVLIMLPNSCLSSTHYGAFTRWWKL
jgi:hypothetical protein